MDQQEKWLLVGTKLYLLSRLFANKMEFSYGLKLIRHVNSDACCQNLMSLLSPRLYVVLFWPRFSFFALRCAPGDCAPCGKNFPAWDPVPRGETKSEETKTGPELD